MDPLIVLPPEVLENIWRYLDVKDLLNCRLVAVSWCVCLSSDPVWKRWVSCPECTSSWETFLHLKKIDYHWNHGIYKSYVEEISKAQFAIADHGVYIGRDKTVRCFSPALQEIYSQAFDYEIVGIHPFSDMVAFVLFEEKFRYQIRIFRGMTEIRYFQSNVNRISSGTQLLCFQKENTVIIFNGKKEEVHSLPGDVVDLIVTNDKLLLKTMSSVFMGCNISCYLHVPGGWEMIWKGRNSPMGCMFGHLEVTSHFLALLGVTQTDAGHSYSELQIVGKGVVDEIEPSRTHYFRSCSSEDTLVYTKNERSLKRLSAKSWTWDQMEVEPGLRFLCTRGQSLILIYDGYWRQLSRSGSYTYSGPRQVQRAVVKQTFLAVWSKTSLHIYNFADDITAD